MFFHDKMYEVFVSY